MTSGISQPPVTPPAIEAKADPALKLERAACGASEVQCRLILTNTWPCSGFSTEPPQPPSTPSVPRTTRWTSNSWSTLERLSAHLAEPSVAATDNSTSPPQPPEDAPRAADEANEQAEVDRARVERLTQRKLARGLGPDEARQAARTADMLEQRAGDPAATGEEADARRSNEAPRQEDQI